MRSLFWSIDCRKKEGQGIYVEERAWESSIVRDILSTQEVGEKN